MSAGAAVTWKPAAVKSPTGRVMCGLEVTRMIRSIPRGRSIRAENSAFWRVVHDSPSTQRTGTCRSDSKNHDRLSLRLSRREVRGMERRIVLGRVRDRIRDERRGEQPEAHDADGAQREAET